MRRMKTLEIPFRFMALPPCRYVMGPMPGGVGVRPVYAADYTTGDTDAD